MKRMVRAAALTNYFEVAQQLALNPSQMLAQVGLDRAMLADPDGRIPAGAVVNLLEESARASQCLTFGLRMAETRQLTDLGAISLLLTHKRTLREVLLAMINYRHLMNEALALQMEDAGTNVIIREEVVTDVSTHSRQATELALGVLARAASALLGNRWKPHRVMFSHEAPPDLHLHRRIFKCKLAFGSEYNAFVCAAQDLDAPSSAANPALARYAEQLLQSLPRAQDRSTSMEVREAIYVLLPMGRATVEQVAQKLGLNVRTLQRQLEDDSATFSELINSVRRELAVRYVRSGQHSLGQVAELLGYSTQTSFTRWFKAEFGVAPRQWQPDATSQPSRSWHGTTVMNRKLGRDGPQLFPLGLGCMGMSEGYGERAERDEQESIATIHRALDLGVNLLDTADIYGPYENELLVGRALQGRRSQAVLATKFGFVTDREQAKTRRIDGRPEYARASCDASLKRLGVDTIDLWYLHRADPAVPIEDTVGAMAACVRAGKVRYLGLSEVSAATLRRAHAVHPISALQSEYSMWTRDPEHNGVLAACKELGVTFVAFSPLGRGFLTGTVRSAETLASDDMRRRLPRFQGENLARNTQLVDAVTQLANRRGCTAAQLALAWVLSRGQHILPIPGTKRRTRLEENVAATRIALSDEELRALEALLSPDAIAGARYPDSLMELVNR